MSLDQILSRGVAEIISEAGLRARIAEGKPLRLKMGFDPSRPLLTIGNMVGIRKLRQFQELGHHVILIVGDWTAQIGDPSGKDQARKMLSYEETRENARTFMDQFFKIVDKDMTEVRWQSEWFGKFKLDDVFHLAKTFTLADMMAHETFRKRWESGQALTLIELLYPALQAYDSIAIESDVEFGGMDQKFNILAGRQLQERRGKRPQEVFLVPLLPGTDGNAKMGKSLGNTIDVYDSPNDIYGKVMSIADAALPVYLTIASDLPADEVTEYTRELAGNNINPRDIKMKLAYDIVRQFHNAAAAREAEAEFIRVFSKRELPTEMETFVISAPMPIVELLVAAKFASSKSQARQLIEQGGVKLNDDRIKTLDAVIPPAEGILSVGRRKFVRLSNTN
ncbi:MAG: tyrosine--tRNA ligase [Anaerolineae bacterium]|nr:tyrosine--tRNA ligase [Anaerolineae bacterium]